MLLPGFAETDKKTCILPSRSLSSREEKFINNYCIIDAVIETHTPSRLAQPRALLALSEDLSWSFKCERSQRKVVQLWTWLCHGLAFPSWVNCLSSLNLNFLL